VQKGNFSSWEENRRRQDNFDARETERLTQEIGELRAAARRTAEWSDRLERTKIGEGVVEGRADRGTIGAQSARVMKRAKSAERRQKTRRRKRKNCSRTSSARHAQDHPAAALCGRSGGSGRSFDRIRTPNGLRTAGFRPAAGERVALTGRNGSGKSSIVKLLAGEPVPHTGTLRLASGLVVSYMPQDTSFLSGTVLDYARSWGWTKRCF
jgi:lincosamide and streptogramin A transport system ATP-binding/permease protein